MLILGVAVKKDRCGEVARDVKFSSVSKRRMKGLSCDLIECDFQVCKFANLHKYALSQALDFPSQNYQYYMTSRYKIIYSTGFLYSTCDQLISKTKI